MALTRKCCWHTCQFSDTIPYYCNNESFVNISVEFHERWLDVRQFRHRQIFFGTTSVHVWYTTPIFLWLVIWPRGHCLLAEGPASPVLRTDHRRWKKPEGEGSFPLTSLSGGHRQKISEFFCLADSTFGHFEHLLIGYMKRGIVHCNGHSRFSGKYCPSKCKYIHDFVRFFSAPVFLPKSIPWISFLLWIPICFSCHRYWLKGGKAVGDCQERWIGIIFRESTQTMIFSLFWRILQLWWRFTTVPEILYTSQSMLMVLSIHTYVTLAIIVSIPAWWSFLLQPTFICDY